MCSQLVTFYSLTRVPSDLNFLILLPLPADPLDEFECKLVSASASSDLRHLCALNPKSIAIRKMNIVVVTTNMKIESAI